MKLRTKTVPVGDRMLIDGAKLDAWADAKAAHALLQALQNEAPGVHGRVTERAAEILASWGVEQEVAG